jgi:hypothetical protein
LNKGTILQVKINAGWCLSNLKRGLSATPAPTISGKLQHRRYTPYWLGIGFTIFDTFVSFLDVFA